MRYLADPDDLRMRREALRRAIERLRQLKAVPIYPFEPKHR
jgi:hypothetical protein